jgi:hypothetical protein
VIDIEADIYAGLAHDRCSLESALKSGVIFLLRGEIADREGGGRNVTANQPVLDDYSESCIISNRLAMCPIPWIH